MFSGIIEHIGKIKELSSAGSGYRLILTVPGMQDRVKEGSSVSVSGVCLTVAAMRDEQLVFDIMGETVRKSTFPGRQAEDRVNIEPALRVGDELGGHLVFGHADGTGTVRQTEIEDEALLLTIRPPQDLMRYMAPQGSVTIDGVSLTVARVAEDDFTVSLIPYTARETTLGSLAENDQVNIECDMLAKYVERLVKK